MGYLVHAEDIAEVDDVEGVLEAVLLNVLGGNSLDSEGASIGDVLCLDLQQGRGSGNLASCLKLPGPEDALGCSSLRTTVEVDGSVLVKQGSEASLR